MVFRRSQPHRRIWKEGKSSLRRHPQFSFSLFIEPAHHYPVEGIGLVDVAEVVGVWDLLVAGTRYQFGELAHRWFRAVWILGTTERQCRDPNRRELGREVVIHDRRRAAEHSRRW